MFKALLGLIGASALVACSGPTEANAASLAAGTTETAMRTETGNFLVPGASLPSTGTEIATFAAGCFWGPEKNYRSVPGVIATSVGYIGGHVDEPTYKEVCTDTTGHAEAVQVEFDPTVVTYSQLVEYFWELHDPTQVNRQGPDWGSQYRTEIFVHNAEQREIAEASKAALEASGKFSKPIATKITDAPTYWFAEEYHQQYAEKGNPVFCRVVPFKG